MGDLDTDVSVDLNADVDSGGLILDLLGKIHLGINDAVAEQRKANQLEQRRLAGLPNYFTVSKASQATGTDTISFGGPQNGRQWEVVLLVGIDGLLVANAAVVTWYVGQNLGAAPNTLMPGTMMRWQFPSLPSQKDFGGKQIILQPNEVLIAQIQSAPAGKTIYLTAAINDAIQDDARFTVATS